jgi:hypothetical protein
MNIVRALALLVIVAVASSACTSVGNLGIVTKPSADATALLKSGKAYKDLGPAEGEACRYFLLGIIPWGDATFSTAVNQALTEKGADALINVTVSNSLYGFIPIYNVFTYTCTNVKGIAIKYQ